MQHYNLVDVTQSKCMPPPHVFGHRKDVVVWCNGSALVSINEVDLRRTRLVLRWVTVSGFSSRYRTFISVCNQPPSPTQPSIPPGSVNEDQFRLGRKRQVWFIALADERGVCRLSVWDPLRTRAITERLKGVFTTRRYTNPSLPYLALPKGAQKRTTRCIRKRDGTKNVEGGFRYGWITVSAGETNIMWPVSR